jgi:hypothetical protein
MSILIFLQVRQIRGLPGIVQESIKDEMRFLRAHELRFFLCGEEAEPLKGVMQSLNA